MIVLDTNVVSEIMKNSPSIHVLTWLDQQPVNQLFITAITVAEISYGINVLPNGKRQQLLESAFHNAVNGAFKHRILFFDDAAAQLYGKLMSHRKALGRPLSVLDGQIAAMTAAKQASLATRNIRDFENCNLELINPF